MECDPRIRDFRNFLFLAWDQLRLPEPTPIQYDIAEYLQNGPRRLCIQAFRGVGKSWITSAFVCHQLLLDPSKNILVVSASKQRADDFSTFTLRLIEEMPILQHLKPREGQRNSKIAFDVGPAPASHAPSVTSRGITSQITGQRADLIISDDSESLNNSATMGMRDKLVTSTKEFEAVIKPEGRIVFLGTPQTEMSIYAQLPERGYDLRIWPARYPDEKTITNLGGKLAPKILKELEGSEDLVGRSTDPKRFDDIDLMEREASYGRTGFALQFMLDTSLSDQDRYPLKLSDLIVMNLNPESAPEKIIWAASPDLVDKDLPNVGFNGDRYYRPMATQGEWKPYSGAVLAIDPAGRGADETAYAVVKMLNSQLFVLEAGGLQGGYDEDVLKSLSVIAKRQDVKQIIVESNFGDGMFTSLLTPVLAKIHPCTIEEVRHNIQKERRIIDTIEPVLSSHRLIVDRKVVEQDYHSTQNLPPEKALKYQLFYQLSRITRLKGALVHDDRLDVLSMAIGYWAEQMAADRDRLIRSAKDDKIKGELENFMRHALGRPKRPTTWMHT
tara:strand:+ start:579 stop:2249 length:1671 start_codon:yes stop_codon:yes gene_type:complete